MHRVMSDRYRGFDQYNLACMCLDDNERNSLESPPFFCDFERFARIHSNCDSSWAHTGTPSNLFINKHCIFSGQCYFSLCSFFPCSLFPHQVQFTQHFRRIVRIGANLLFVRAIVVSVVSLDLLFNQVVES